MDLHRARAGEMMSGMIGAFGRQHLTIFVVLLGLYQAKPAEARPQLRAVIFDLGGVIVDLDQRSFRRRMAALVGKDLRSSAFRRIVERFEAGRINIRQFRTELRHFRPGNKQLSDRQIDAAWNAQIGAVDCRKLRLVRRLRKAGIRTFVLSTSNPLHARVIEKRFRRCFPSLKKKDNVFDRLFDKTYFTFNVGLLKPDPKLFLHVIKDARLVRRQTVFIDDGRANVLAAQMVGLYALVIHDNSFTNWLPELLKR